MIKAAISDFDGTLFDTFEANYQAYSKAFLNLFGMHLDRQFYKDCFGLRIDDICAKLNITDGDDINSIKKLKAKYYPEFFSLIRCNTELVDTLKFYKSNGIKIAIATTAARKNVEGILKYFFGFDWDLTFDLIICGDEVKHGKPNNEVYVKAMNRLNVLPQETIIFEDSEVGIEAAKSANGNIIKINF